LGLSTGKRREMWENRNTPKNPYKIRVFGGIRGVKNRGI
jgi:hypothetical protein